MQAKVPLIKRWGKEAGSEQKRSLVWGGMAWSESQSVAYQLGDLGLVVGVSLIISEAD